jgi:hypothetical protein
MAACNYVFVRQFEDQTLTQSSSDLEEFKKFCHYSSLSDWKKHKELIELCLSLKGFYPFDGNDVKYYILKK